MKNLVKILRYIIPFWGYAALNILFNLLSVVFSLVSFAFFIPVLEILFKMREPIVSIPPPVSFANITDSGVLKDNFYYTLEQMINRMGDMNALFVIALIIVGLFMLKNLFRYFGMFFLAPVRNGVVKNIRNEMYNKILILPLSYYSEQKKGDLMARMTSDVQEIEWSIMNSLEMVFRDPFTIVVYIITMLVISPSLTGFVLVLLPLSAFLIGRIGRTLKRTSRKGQTKMGELQSIMEETMDGLRVIKAFNAIDSANKSFQKVNTRYTQLMVRLYRKRDLASPLSEFLGVLVLVVVLWYGGKIVLSPDSSINAAVFLVYLGIFSQILTPAKSISKAVYNIQRGAASVERIEHILNAEEIIVEKPDALPITDFTSCVELQNVCFRYEKDPILKNLNLKIEKGKTIALVGPSGGGKSTLINLLPRFYDVSEGIILVDDVPVKDLKINDLRSLMGVVTQDTILFNDSVLNNIGLGVEVIDKERVIAAAKIANAHEFIVHLPEGYDTNIGDKGVKLSGGQKQRLSIARAVYKNPPIMLLDEATSALDTESEKLVQDALDNLMTNRTSVVIAHRLSTIRNADEIVVVEKGEIIERGTHEQLFQLNGTYTRLCKMQSFV